jgi:hypothetical protein
MATTGARSIAKDISRREPPEAPDGEDSQAHEERGREDCQADDEQPDFEADDEQPALEADEQSDPEADKEQPPNVEANEASNAPADEEQENPKPMSSRTPGPMRSNRTSKPTCTSYRPTSARSGSSTSPSRAMTAG